MSKPVKTTALLTSALLLTAFCGAQNFSVDWFSIDGGGGSSAGGSFSLSGTVGQPDAGRMSGGIYTLEGGFWGIATAVQTPGAPLLTIRTTSTNTVVVSWPSPSTGFSLFRNTDLNTTNWVTAGSPSDDGTTKTVIIIAPLGNQFFKLIHP